MTMQEIKEQVPSLRSMSDTEAYKVGLKLLKELQIYRHIINRNEYRKLYNAIQEQRFR